MTLLIIYVALALGVSFLCSVLEAVLLSLTPSYVSLLVEKRPRVGHQLARLKADVDRPLAAILSLNTIAHTVGATGAGAQAVRVFGEAWVGVISAVLTLLILVLSEIIPKTLGALYWRPLAPTVTYTLRFVILIMAPFVWLSRGVTRLIARDAPEATVSREEVAALAESGHREGALAPRESHILRSLMLGGELRARDVMTPRVVVSMADERDTVGSIDPASGEWRFTRIPVHSGDREHVTGYVRRDDVLSAKLRGEQDRNLASLRLDLAVVPVSKPLTDLLEEFLSEQEVIGQVIDEHGGFAGLITMEDVIESLLGLEIVDESDSVEDMRVLAKQLWRKRARRLGITPEDAD